MKVKTSITLSADILKEIDEVTENARGRSMFIEQAVSEYLRQRRHEQQQKADLEILNEASERLNAEASDVLSYQVEI